MHRIAVVAVPPVGAFELSIPDLLFDAVQIDGRSAYATCTCTPQPGPVATRGGFDVLVTGGLDAIADADTVLITGTGARDGVADELLSALRDAARRGARIASICTGAFVLAAAGLLDGRCATTHWRYAAELAQRYPRVLVRPEVLFVEDGPIVTSAGLAAGIDLCLHLIRCDHGAAVANDIARLAVVAPVRPGGQAQFLSAPVASAGPTTLDQTRAWALTRIQDKLTLADLARHANTSIRTLNRRFRAETGLSPLQWLLQLRIDRARELLETTDLPVAVVAHRSGLGSVDSLRDHFVRTTGLTPSAYRAAFTHSPTPTKTRARGGR
ncbi:GlxA family transcriptional regulator [Mycobacterium palustre]|uniref:AraC family transcriptional regulator n=1 Tax=Mycobacterium palustre TaxID=153971 RepID=A0A1X1ZQF4_9MYCO|nr:helix-turn-helix domain-containing protein [Mycobacterium palustre]MCV7101915.1 helix-turn-helix domain-containing protein [Mycobacterium palustre]ORW25573.1 AraC family transcriptional regulator [Mycobacterium palustre]